MMKNISFIVLFFLFINCEDNIKNENENIATLFKNVFYETSKKNKEESIALLNDKIKNSKSYFYKIMITDSLKNGIDYDIDEFNEEHWSPHIAHLTICYKSRDSILIENLENSIHYLDKYIDRINFDNDEIFTEFSIEASKSGKMSVEEWENSIDLLKTILRKITKKQINDKTNKLFRTLFIFKAGCYSQPGPPPPPTKLE